MKTDLCLRARRIIRGRVTNLVYGRSIASITPCTPFANRAKCLPRWTASCSAAFGKLIIFSIWCGIKFDVLCSATEFGIKKTFACLLNIKKYDSGLWDEKTYFLNSLIQMIAWNVMGNQWQYRSQINWSIQRILQAMRIFLEKKSKFMPVHGNCLIDDYVFWSDLTYRHI